MGSKQTISSLVTGGEASAGPPLGPALGPMGVNIMEVISAINEKTNEFKGMKIPVTVSVDSETKKWEIEVGIPSASALILKEANIQKGSSTSGAEWVADIGIDSIVKVSNVKLESSYARELKSVAKQVIGTCQCLGIKIEGKMPKEITAEINAGKWDEKLTVSS
jgi:large subunit ribosomal protein L11|tara:strand:+ start:5806 stop:6297 length:492 start_codon:yes stop_codon:yes gene_type:complete